MMILSYAVPNRPVAISIVVDANNLARTKFMSSSFCCYYKTEVWNYFNHELYKYLFKILHHFRMISVTLFFILLVSVNYMCDQSPSHF